MSNAWTPTDEAAYLAATATPGQAAVSAEEMHGNRYTAIRRVLKAGAPLSTQEYLLGQMLLVLMDVGAEIAGLRDDVQRTNAYLDEQIVQRSGDAKG